VLIPVACQVSKFTIEYVVLLPKAKYGGGADILDLICSKDLTININIFQFDFVLFALNLF
jgi:hypothetical protein